MAVANGWIVVKRSAATPGLADICNGGRVYPSIMAANAAAFELVDVLKITAPHLGWMCANRDADCHVIDIYDSTTDTFVMAYVIAPLVAMHTFRG